MGKYITPAVLLAAVNIVWIAYGVATGWSPALIIIGAVIWLAALAITIRQARRHA